MSQESYCNLCQNYKPEYRQAICSLWFPDNENMPNIFCLLKLRDSHLNVLKVCLRYISFGAWGQGERASNSCGQSLDIFQASWPETETGSILVTGRIVSPICVILSTDDLPASSCLQSPLQTCKPCLTIMNDVQYSEKVVTEPQFYKSMNECYLNFNRDACLQSSSQMMRLVIFRIFATPNPCEWRFCKQASQVQCGDNSSKHQFSTTNDDCHTPPAAVFLISSFC